MIISANGNLELLLALKDKSWYLNLVASVSQSDFISRCDTKGQICRLPILSAGIG